MEFAFGLEKLWNHVHRDARNIPWHVCLIAMILGIVLGDAASPSPWSSLALHAGFLVMAAPLCVLLFVLRIRCPKPSLRTVAIWLAAWNFLWFALGFWLSSEPHRDMPPMGVACEITARADAVAPGVRNFTAEVREWRCGDVSADKPSETPLRVRIDAPPGELETATTHILEGTVFRAEGEFSPWQASEVPGTFDEQSWAHASRIDARFRRARTRGTPNPLQILHEPAHGTLEIARRAAFERMAAVSAEGILPALVLGTTKDVGDGTRDAFGRLGIAHVLAVSGLHFGMVSLMLIGLLNFVFGRIPWIMRRFSRQRAAAVASLPMLAVYLVFVGAPISARRALIMAAACVVGRLLARAPSQARSLVIAAVAILIFEPRAVFQVSFQLSFAAVLGILWGIEFYERSIRTPIRGAEIHPKIQLALCGAASMAVMTLATSITTAPVVIHHFGQLPILGILANFLVIPYVSFILMPAAMVAALAAVIEFPGADFVIRIAGWLESALVWFADLCVEHIPASCIDIAPHPAIVLLTAATAIAVLFRIRPKRPRIIVAAAFAALTAAVLVYGQIDPRFLSRTDALRVSFVAMGQADATLVEFPDGTTMLVDAGAEIQNDRNATRTRLIPYLRSLGIRHVDTVVLTHGDHDHVAGLAPLLEYATVGEIWHNGMPDQSWMSAAVDQTVRDIRTMPSQFDAGGPRVDILWPNAESEALLTAEHALNANEMSIVLRLEYGDFSLLLMGDAGIPVESRLVASEAVRVTTVLKVGHHGSKSASSEAWIDAVRPQFAVYSAALHNRYRFPHPDVQTRLLGTRTRQLQTGIHGTVRMTTDGTALRVQTMR